MHAQDRASSFVKRLNTYFAGGESSGGETTTKKDGSSSVDAGVNAEREAHARWKAQLADDVAASEREVCGAAHALLAEHGAGERVHAGSQEKQRQRERQQHEAWRSALQAQAQERAAAVAQQFAELDEALGARAQQLRHALATHRWYQTAADCYVREAHYDEDDDDAHSASESIDNKPTSNDFSSQAGEPIDAVDSDVAGCDSPDRNEAVAATAASPFAERRRRLRDSRASSDQSNDDDEFFSQEEDDATAIWDEFEMQK